MKTLLYIAPLLTLLIAFATKGFAAVNTQASLPFSFTHLTMQDGLSNNKVNDIYRDAEGFVWFSTTWGLNRFDGYSMKVFLNNPQDSLSLGDNDVAWVRDIANDRMLVRSQRHFWIYDKHSETFVHADELISLTGVDEVTAIAFVDSKKNIWLSSGSQLAVVSSDTWTSMLNTLSGERAKITGFCQKDDRRYTVRLDGSVDIYTELPDGSFKLKSTADTPAGPGYHNIFIDSSDNWWLTTIEGGVGVWHKGAADGEWQLFTDDVSSPRRVPGFVIRCVTEDTNGRIWVASDHGGINVLGPKASDVAIIRSEKGNLRGLPSNSISCLTADAEGCVWVGDVSLGASLFAEPVYKFDADDLSADRLDHDFVAQVNSITQDVEGNVWYGTNDNGLLKTSASGEPLEIFRSHPADPKSLSSDIIVSIKADSRGGVWVGTYLGGLCHYDGQHFERFMGRTDVAPAAAYENVWAVSEDFDGDFWVGSLGRGLACRDSRTGVWRQWDRINDGLTSDYIQKIVPLRGNSVCVGTSGGLCVINKSNETVRQVSSDIGLVNTRIVDLYADSRGLLWVAASNGLYAIDPESGNTLVHLHSRNGLSTDAVVGIVEDRRGAMWVSATSGIININVLRNSKTDEYEFNSFTYSDQDGFLSGNINERSIVCTTQGEVIVGRGGGVNRFRPELIRYNKEKPIVRFTSFAAFGNEVHVGQQHNGTSLLADAMPYIQELSLPHDLNMFSIKFSTLSNILPQKVKYDYMLEGFNDTWLSTNEPSVTYTNLSPGSYRLMVKASNCDGVESAEPSVLIINILPPWYRTVWAYIFYVLAIIGIVVFCIWRLREREREKYQIKQMTAEAERQKQLDDMKLRFFTNISHELRTPLTLIVSPIENILSSMSSTDALRPQMELIERNSHKLLGMVNQLLDFRKTDLGQMTAVMSQGDMVSFVKTNCQQFVELITKRIDYHFTTSAENIYMKFDRDKMGKILNNLLSNAYKFTPEGGSITVSVDKTPDDKSVEIKVTDTGMGIAPEHKEHIFERFYQVPQTDTSLSGSGIGLHMVREFTELQGGTVTLADNPVGRGVIFTVTLPITVNSNDYSSEDADTDPNADPDADLASTPDGRKKILVVDDNEDFITLLRETLQDTYAVISAPNGRDAFDLAVSDQPDMIISDVMMPIMDGNEFCRKVKNDIRTSHIPFIMLTAKTAEEHTIEGLENGADDYLIKPFNPKILRMKVQKIIELGQHRQQSFGKQIDPEPSQIAITPLDEQLIQRAIAYVEQNISSPDLSVEDLSKHLGMSRVHLYKKLMALTGRPPIEFIRVIRLKRAAQLLKDPAQNVADVAYAVGFNNPKYFSKYFKEEFGVLPSKFASSNANPDVNEDPDHSSKE